jgi:hypothetical protein
MAPFSSRVEHAARAGRLLAKSTIRPEDAQNPIRHLGLERGFPPSIAVQTAASEFPNSVSSERTDKIERQWIV